MKKSTQLLLLAGALGAGFNAMADEATFEESNASSTGVFNITHRTSTYMADFTNNGKLDIIYGGQLDPEMDKPGIFNWTQLQSIYFNGGNDEWTFDRLTAVRNDNPEMDGDEVKLDEDGNPVYNYHTELPKHGIRMGCFNNYAGIDYNNDGLVDLIVSEKDGTDNWTSYPDEMKRNHLSLYRNNGDGTFTLVEEAAFPPSAPDNDGIGFNIAVGDYDRDGYVDFFVSVCLGDGRDGGSNGKEGDEYPGRRAALYRNLNGTGAFECMNIAQTKGGVWTSEIKDPEGNVMVEKRQLEGWFLPISGNAQFADINNDGWLDLVLVGYCDECWDPAHPGGGYKGRIYLNQEGKSFVDVTPDDAAFATLGDTSINLADFNADGYLDFFQTGYNNGWDAYLFTNTQEADAPFDAYPAFADDLGIEKTQKKTYVRDFNGDGYADVYYCNHYNHIVISYGNAMGTFETVHYDACPYGDSAHGAVGDINGNGLSDIFHPGYGNSPRLYYNTTDASVEATAAPENVSVVYADGKLTISWDEVDGAEAYNVYVKNAEGKLYCIVPADPETGFVKVTNEKLVALRPDQTEYSISVPEGDYTVGVQTISLLNETYSPFTTATTAGIEKIATGTKASRLSVKAGKNGIMVDGNGEAVTVFNAMGQTVATGVAGKLIEVAADGVLIVTKGNETAKVIK